MSPDLARASAKGPVRVTYHRLSREEQAEGHGLERQRHATATWCADRGLTVDAQLEDVGHSAFTADHIRRGEMGLLLQGIKAGDVKPGSTIVMENLDRLSRQDPFKAIAVFTSIVSEGVTIVTTCDGYHYTQSGTAMEKMMTVFMSIMHFGRGNSESEIKSIRVAEAWQKKHRLAQESKVPHGAKCPAWIRSTPDGYRFVEGRDKVVKWMCEASIAGWGRRKILSDLVARDIAPWLKPTKKRPRPVWGESYIQKILTGGEACGDYHPSGREVIHDYYPAAVDRATFELARAAAAARKGGGGRKGDFKNLFQNRCKCGVCGSGMTMENKGSRSSGPKLVCRLATSGQCTHNFRHDYQLTEITVVFGIGRHADKLVQASQGMVEELRGKVAIKEAERRDVAERIKRLVRRMETNDDEALDDALRELRVASTRLAAEAGALRQELAGAGQASGPSSPHSMMAFYERLRAVPEDERASARIGINQGLKFIVKRIVFLDGKLRTDFVDGGTAYADIRAGRPPRPNPGQFSSTMQEGRQLRRGAPQADPEGEAPGASDRSVEEGDPQAA